jgi:hypothetical protein
LARPAKACSVETRPTKGKTRADIAACNTTQVLDQQREMMVKWADSPGRLRDGTQVIALKAA